MRTTSTTGKVPGKPWKSNAILASFAKYETNHTTPDVRHLTYKASPWAPVCVAASGGGLCFASLYFIDTERAPAGHHFTLSTLDDQVSAGGLPQGDYSELTAYSVRESLMLVAKKGATGVRLAGGDHAVVGGTGVRLTS